MLVQAGIGEGAPTQEPQYPIQFVTRTEANFSRNCAALQSLSAAFGIMDLKLPKLGEGADSGVVVNVFVKEGDTVAKDQAVIELENEKAVASIPSTEAGVVTKVYVQAGDKISIGQRILTIGGNGAASAPAPATTRPAATPAAKHLAPEPEPEAEEAFEADEDATPASGTAPQGSHAIRPWGTRRHRYG